MSRAGDAWQIRVEQQDGKSVVRSVRTGAVTDESAEILEGLKAGERVWVPAKS
jgi:hypothetical protein